VAFIIDHLFLVSFAYLYSAYEHDTTWVLLYILPLEGAIRYAMSGAIASVVALSLSETGRDIMRQQLWGFDFQFVPSTSFRIGIMAIIGMVGGVMARNLERERAEVEKRAELMSDLAERETASRKEIDAFNQATMAGLSTGDFLEAMRRMINTIGETLEYESLAMGLLEDTGWGPQIRIVAGYQYPQDAIGRSINLEEGVCGPVVASGTPALVNDVRSHPTYLGLAPWARSEMAVPLMAGDKPIGVLNVESPRLNAFNEEDLAQLERLGNQVAVVVENARVLEKELAAVERLTELDTMKTDFVAITSHELRTPLTVIQGFIKTMRRSDVDFSKEQIDGYLEIVDQQASRLQTVVEDLLFVSRIETGAVDLQHSSFDLKDVIEQIVRARPPDEAARISVKASPDVKVVSDKERLTRVLENLIDNAIRFSPPTGEVSIQVWDRDDSVTMEIEDTGIGIPANELDKIFDRFHQVGGSMKRKQQGFGLGLYISKQILDALGGSIWVKSEQGRGSLFTVTIPREPAVAPVKAAEA
ncbi:MAG TPA: ATP-binding protein, partial [Actinomycetota bacterium]|nr:ATP-binding protein [Actinomycetota bacterium]